MAIETERKFLTNAHLKKALLGKSGILIQQGYLSTDPEKTIRIRLAGEKAFLTVKGKGKISRPEFEFDIPVKEATEMLDLFAENLIEKTRYKIEFQGFLWEVDVFHGQNDGLIVAEIELDSETEEFPLPAWISKEVTGDKRYYNSFLSQNAFKFWKVG